MNCAPIEPLLLAERDGALSPAQRAALAQHLAGCPGCAQLRQDLASALDAWKTEVAQVPVPAAHAAWTSLQARLPGKKTAARRRLAPILWFSSPLAAAAALLLLLYPQAPQPALPLAGLAVPHVDFVEAGDANATTMVYVDKESGWLVVWAMDAPGNGKT